MSGGFVVSMVERVLDDLARQRPADEEETCQQAENKDWLIKALHMMKNDPR